MADKIIAYKVGDTGTVVLPSDMSSVNTVICLGAGAGGSAGSTTLGGRNANGGSSGGIHIATNVTLTASQSVQIQVGTKGTGGTFGSTATDARGSAGGSTWLNGASLAAAVVGAQGGQIAADSFSATVGGASFGTAGGTKTNGSAGGAGSSASGSGSGAGAPGTTGAGGAGVVATAFSGGSGGGAADGGTAGSLATNTFGAAGGTRTGGSGGAGGAITDANGTAGVAGNGGGGGAANTGIGGAGSFPVLWTATDGAYAAQTFGSGSGGGAGGAFTGKGGAGSYGAGGGGAYGTSGKSGGDGGDGLIIIIYTPATPSPVFSVNPSISPGSGTAGSTTFTATDGTASNTTGYTRRWLLDGVSIGTGTTVLPVTSGSLVLEVTATGAGGSTVATSSAVTVSPAPTGTSYFGGGMAIGIGIGTSFPRMVGGVTAMSPTPSPTPDGADYATAAPWLSLATSPSAPAAFPGGGATVNPSNFLATIRAADGTTSRYILEPGAYPLPTASEWGRFPAFGQVTFQSVTRGAAVWTNPQTNNSQDLRFVNAGNLCFDGFALKAPNVVADDVSQTFGTANIIYLNNVTNFRLTRCDFSGGAGTGTYAGCPSGRAVNINGGSLIQIDRNNFYDPATGQSTAYGVNLQPNGTTLASRPTDVYIGFNRREYGGVDFFDCYGANKVLLEYNEEYNNKWIPNDLHWDFAQFGQVTGGIERTSSNIVIRRNLAMADSNSLWVYPWPTGTPYPTLAGNTHNAPQGVFAADETRADMLDRFLIENNDFYAPSNNMISIICGLQYGLIRGNRGFRSSATWYATENGGSPMAPFIKVDEWAGLPAEVVDTVTIQNNQVQTVTLGASATNSPAPTGTTAMTSLDDAAFATARSSWRAVVDLYR